MKVSMDGLRRNMVGAYNRAIREYKGRENKDDARREFLEEALDELGEYIGGFLCIYDDDTEHFSDLSEVVELERLEHPE